MGPRNIFKNCLRGPWEGHGRLAKSLSEAPRGGCRRFTKSVSESPEGLQEVCQNCLRVPKRATGGSQTTSCRCTWGDSGRISKTVLEAPGGLQEVLNNRGGQVVPEHFQNLSQDAWGPQDILHNCLRGLRGGCLRFLKKVSKALGPLWGPPKQFWKTSHSSPGASETVFENLPNNLKNLPTASLGLLRHSLRTSHAPLGSSKSIINLPLPPRTSETIFGTLPWRTRGLQEFLKLSTLCH